MAHTLNHLELELFKLTNVLVGVLERDIFHDDHDGFFVLPNELHELDVEKIGLFRVRLILEVVLRKNGRVQFVSFQLRERWLKLAVVEVFHAVGAHVCASVFLQIILEFLHTLVEESGGLQVQLQVFPAHLLLLVRVRRLEVL